MLYIVNNTGQKLLIRINIIFTLEKESSWSKLAWYFLILFIKTLMNIIQHVWLDQSSWLKWRMHLTMLRFQKCKWRFFLISFSKISLRPTKKNSAKEITIIILTQLNNQQVDPHHFPILEIFWAFPIGYCIVCTSLIYYSFWLHVWYLQTFLV